MSIKEHRQDFNVMVVEADIDSGAAAHAILYRERYGVEAYYTYEAAIERIRSLPPHIVILGTSAVPQGLPLAIQEIQRISPEIIVIGAADELDLVVVREMLGKGVYSYLIKPLVSSEELLGVVDQAAEKLYFQYTNEQLFEQLKQSSQMKSSSFLDGVDEAPVMSVHQETTEFSLSHAHDFFSQVKNIPTHNKLIEFAVSFLSEQSQHSPVLFFRWVEQHRALVVVESCGIEVDQVRGVGVRFDSLTHVQQQYLLQHPHEISELRSLSTEVFKSENFFAAAFFNAGKVEGVWYAAGAPSAQFASLHFFVQLLSLAYTQISLSKRLFDVDPYDGEMNGILNRRFFEKAVSVEVSRSRRLNLPSSLLYFGIDAPGFTEGVQQIAQFVREHCRQTDFVGLLRDGEVAVLLAHTDLPAALAKAESLRKGIAQMEFSGLEEDARLNLNISLGVSSYPELSSGADDLLQSAQEAMREVQGEGGNCICEATVGEGFKPDFVPLKSQGMHV